MKLVEFHIGYEDYVPIMIDVESVMAYNGYGRGRTRLVVKTGTIYELHEDYETVDRRIRKALAQPENDYE
ncbi:MAG: hypothetical protein WC822_06800 [Candidatus Paceibacterota bacterium]|jgi:hypothetical protein